jgi:phospholipid transport system substrate-binding protein
MKKIFLPIITLLLLTTSFSHAYNGQYPNNQYPQQQQSQGDPVTYIQNALEKLEEFSANANTASPIMLRDFIENEIIPHFSFTEMSRWITGPYAQRMSNEEKADFQQRLKEAFLKSLSKHLGSFDSIKNRVRFYPTRHRGYNEATVSVQVHRGNGYPVKLDFRMRLMGQDWKVVDIRANGTSAVLYYRQLFIADLRQYRRR